MKKLLVGVALAIAAFSAFAQTPSTVPLITDKTGAVIPGQYWDAVGLSYKAVQVPLAASSGNVANASAVATLAAASGKVTYITGFEITSGGATAAANVVVTVTGTAGGTLTYIYSVPAGVTGFGQPLIVDFGEALSASAVNTAIVVTLPALGSGNLNAAVVAHGYQQ